MWKEKLRDIYTAAGCCWFWSISNGWHRVLYHRVSGLIGNNEFSCRSELVRSFTESQNVCSRLVQIIEYLTDATLPLAILTSAWALFRVVDDSSLWKCEPDWYTAGASGINRWITKKWGMLPICTYYTQVVFQLLQAPFCLIINYGWVSER